MVRVVIISIIFFCNFACNFAVDSEVIDFKKISPLNQEWELYWNKLLEPDDFHDQNIIYNKKQNLPFFWNKIELNNQKLSSQGFLTLKKVVRIPESLIGRKLGIRVPEMFSAYKLFVNGNLKAANGTVSKIPEAYEPEWAPQTIYFTSLKNEIEFILQIANFSYNLGGSWRNIEFGVAEKINTKTNLLIFMDYFLFASVLTMGLYHIALFLKRRESFAALYFSLLCLIVSLRTMVSSEILIYNFFNPSWEFLIKLNLITVALTPPCLSSSSNFYFTVVHINLLQKQH